MSASCSRFPHFEARSLSLAPIRKHYHLLDQRGRRWEIASNFVHIPSL